MTTWTSRLIMLVVLASILLSGCTKELKSKTVIIPDTEESSRPDKVNEDFAVNKIYTLLESGDINGDILGWIDENQVLGAYGRELDRSFERVDYKFDSRQKIVNIKSGAQGAKVSPDGRYMAYFVNEDDNYKLVLFDLANQEETIIDEKVEGALWHDPLTWSNNSQYVCYGIGEDRGDEESDGSLIAYDVIHKSSKEYVIPSWNIKEMSFGVQLSDDGESALIIQVLDGRYQLVYGKLMGSEFISESEQPIHIEGAWDYINKDQIMFISAGGSLQLFDRRNATTTTLLENIGTFQLSKEHKYIAYSKNKEEIFVAKLQGNSIINEVSIYKGLIPYQLQWSPDDKKILLSGRKVYSRVAPLPAPVPAEAPAQAPTSAEVKSNHSPFIIEFK